MMAGHGDELSEGDADGLAAPAGESGGMLTRLRARLSVRGDASQVDGVGTECARTRVASVRGVALEADPVRSAVDGVSGLEVDASSAASPSPHLLYTRVPRDGFVAVGPQDIGEDGHRDIDDPQVPDSLGPADLVSDRDDRDVRDLGGHMVSDFERFSHEWSSFIEQGVRPRDLSMTLSGYLDRFAGLSRGLFLFRRVDHA